MKKEKEERRPANAEEVQSPTRYPQLNVVLQDLVSSSHDVLGENFCGAYLQGSFALGDADEYSDVDFLIVTNDEVAEDQLMALQAMHKRIYGLETQWAQHLEGSYFPKKRLRHVDHTQTPLMFLDNGASELISDDHCNTAVVRWVLREHGITLAGPNPKSLVDSVPAGWLRREAVEGIREYAAWAPEPTNAGPMSRWKQPYLVLTFCRMLNTLETGTVATKRNAVGWAIKRLDPEWSSLIQRALDDRPDPWQRVHQAADAEITKQTLNFVDYALALASREEGARKKTSNA